MHRLILAAAFALAGAGYSFAEIIAPGDLLNSWTQGPTPLGNGPSFNPDMKWTVANGGIETSNGSGGIYSSFSLTGDFRFSVRVRSITPDFADNDLWGLTFGFQDTSNHYRLGWGAGGYTDLAMIGGTGAHGLFLAKQVNDTPSLLFNNSGLFWENERDYDVSVFRAGNNIGFSVIRVTDGAVMGAATFADSSFVSGKVGLYGDSQQARFTDVEVSAVPEPSTAVGVCSLCLIFAGAAWRRRQRIA